MRTALAAALAVLLAAPAAATCRIEPEHIGGTQVYGDEMSSGRCFVSAQSNAVNGLVYRSYGFYSNGLLMVFSSYGEGDDVSTLTSAREFYFFPRLRHPGVEKDAAAKTLTVVMSDGGRFAFDTDKGEIASVDRGDVAVSPRVDPADRGGVEFPRYAGLMLDVGFRMGESPAGRRNADSTFRSAHGQTCTVKNSEVFEYANGDHRFKFDDAALKVFLRGRCPNLPVSF